MSDPFMLALIDEIGIKYEIGQMMELPRAEIDNILMDGFIVSPHHKMLKVNEMRIINDIADTTQPRAGKMFRMLSRMP